MSIFCKISIIFALLAVSDCLQDCVLHTDIPGYDIADNAKKYPNPFEWYTNTAHPGVTLPGPWSLQKCKWVLGKNFFWNEKVNTCILNGQGYPMTEEVHCDNDLFRDNKESFTRLYTLFRDYAFTKAQPHKLDDGSVAYLANITFQGRHIQAAMSIGHGVLDGLCGDCSIIKNGDRYVVHLQTAVRAWSLELTGGASTWIASDNYGGTCYVPQVEKISCDFLNNPNQKSSQASSVDRVYSISFRGRGRSPN